MNDDELARIKTLVIEEKLNELKDSIQDIYLSTKQVLTHNEACKITGFKKSTMYQLTHKKRIPHYRPTNGAVFFDRDELYEWMKQNKVEVKK